VISERVISSPSSKIGNIKTPIILAVR
jgi:hypothetical protein